MKIKDTEIKVVRGDITELKADAIVNAANNKGVMGGGVAGAIKKKGGKAIEDEAVKKCPIEIGEAIFTSAGFLKAKYIIHASTMGMDFKTDEVKIRDACRNSLRVADELGVESIVFPALGCGVGGFPLLASAKIMAQEVWRYLREERSNLREISFCLYSKEAYEVFDKGVIKYLEHILYKLQNGPFTTVDAIIEIYSSSTGGGGGIVIIQRSNPPFGWALPGGFVDYGESLEEAVVREAKEETGLDIVELKQLHTYSNPKRDPRFHTIGTVFSAKAKGNPKAGDDAAALRVINLKDIEGYDFAFDHKEILIDYLKSVKA
ncbi:MAG: macro domain-containing protein [Candidatus Omnitrophota bacterium]|jgi:O-acetyl-ADP-ribose deacetylase (regulator of RNase III)/ADP-ribose pyrophosphatase YjhB (NUDIX family)